jgi:hypothetical protein
LDFIGGPITGDGAWHHLLFSFDISGSVTSTQPADTINGRPATTTTCKAWLAVDDKNYTGMALQRRLKLPDGLIAPMLPGVPSSGVIPFGPVTSYSRDSFTPALGENAILPQNVWVRGFTGNPRTGLPRYVSTTSISSGSYYVPAGDFNALEWTGLIWPLYADKAPGKWLPTLTPARPTVPDPATTLDLPTYSCSGFMLPTADQPIGIPASKTHLEHNTGLEMAELQIWANQTLDTGIPENRRLFIDVDGKPTSMSVAEKVLGMPDIKLHGTGNWKKGKNTGKTGYDDEGQPIAAGQFEPTGSIEKFLPDPELNK